MAALKLDIPQELHGSECATAVLLNQLQPKLKVVIRR